MKSPFRYPGSKAKLLGPILANLEIKDLYSEPFIGGGSVAIAVAEKFPNISIHLNDLDSWIYSFWKVVICGDLVSLLEMIDQPVTVDLFNSLRQSEDSSELDIAYKAIFFNRTTFSGILRSGPIGGQSQSGKYKIDCRYNAITLKKQLENIRTLFSGRTTVTNQNVNTMNFRGAIYLDPPYYVEGAGLYREQISHIGLSRILKDSDSKGWLLSYDDCPEIRDMYSGCRIIDVQARYSVSVSKRKNELLILPPVL